jgi:pimeloyl-ACP methyl ester carboxylesterase
MKVFLVPGFWLGAWSWSRIAPALEAAGHDVTAVTLPGLESADADRSGIGLAEHVAAIVELIDASDEPVVLVGHSGGGTVIHAAVDQRPARVARAVYVDSGPLPHGVATNPHLPAEGADLPLPPWDAFRTDGSRDLDGFTEAQLDDFRARAGPAPCRRCRRSASARRDGRRRRGSLRRARHDHHHDVHA